MKRYPANRRPRLFVLFLVVLAAALALPLAAQAADTTPADGFTVDSTIDAFDANLGDEECDDGEGRCTLRAAIEEAGALEGATTSFDGTVDIPDLGGDSVADVFELTECDDLDVDRDLVIDGAGPEVTIIDGSDCTSVIDTDGTSSDVDIVTISDLTIRNANANLEGDTGGAIDNDVATLTLDNVHLTENVSTDDGGAIENDDDGTVKISNSQLTDNSAEDDGGAIDNDLGVVEISSSELSGNSAAGDDGGAIENDESSVLTVTDSQLTNNLADDDGGALENDGTATLTNVLVSENVAEDDGGGISNDDEATLTVTDSTVSDNDAGDHGGGITIDGPSETTITRSTISRNSASTGGGIFVELSFEPSLATAVALENVTISGNDAGEGGGIYSQGADPEVANDITLTNVTLTGNVVAEGSGAGIFEEFFEEVASTPGVTLKNTIVANNVLDVEGTTTLLNCGGQLPISDGHNLEDADTCELAGTADISDTAAALGPLADNGGPTETHALLAGSPAIDSADNSACPDTDQRGVDRPQGAVCDRGAYELEKAGAPAPSSPQAPLADLSVAKTASPGSVTVGQNITYTVTITNNGPGGAANVAVTDHIPGNTSLVSASPSSGSCSGTAPLTCSLGTIGPGASATITVVVQALAPGTALNSATAVSGTPESNVGNNSASASAEVQAPAFTPPKAKPAACASLRVGVRSLTVGKRVVLQVTVRDQRGKAMKGITVRVRGAGVAASGKSNAQGVARIAVRPTKPGVVRIRAGTARCSKSVGVRGAFQPPITG